MTINIKSDKGVSTSCRDIFYGMAYGGAFMVGVSPFVNYFNNVSVVATKYNYCWGAPYIQVFRGVGLASESSWKNLFRGLSAHYAKELPRLAFKPFGLYTLKPYLDDNFSEQQSAFIFASTLAGAEMLIANPADSIRVQRQAGGIIDYSMQSLYRGAVANGVRQFLTWYTFSKVNGYLNKSLSKNGIPENSLYASCIKGLAVGFALVPIFPVERLKNEIQHQARGDVSESYIATARKICLRRGARAMFFGAGAKCVSHSIQATAASCMVSMSSCAKS